MCVYIYIHLIIYMSLHQVLEGLPKQGTLRQLGGPRDLVRIMLKRLMEKTAFIIKDSYERV